MPLSVGVNLRVTGHCNQGGRKYMEDMFSVAYQQTADGKDLKYAFFGIFDGHGGGEAATFAKEHLMDQIVKQKSFWSDKDDEVLRAIRDGYVNTHYAMWRELDKWPRTASGLPSTAGTTASVAFIRKGKIYIGHVGDSGIILGYQQDGDPQWKARALTRDHKPESDPEIRRIQESGGKVVCKSGVPRVVWNRPRIGHKGPVRRSTHIDEIPFLAVARSLGDLWSYNSELNRFVVSPEPDVGVVVVDVKSHRCLIFGTDGLWNMLNPQAAVAIVQAAERHNEKHLIASQQTGNEQSDVQMWINPSKSLVDRALERWSSTRLRADNTSVVTLMLDPPGPSRTEVLLSQKKEHVPSARGQTRPVFLTPVPCASEKPQQKPAPSQSPPEPSVVEPEPAVPSSTFANAPEEPENSDSKQPDSSNSSVDSRKVTEVGDILHRERSAAGNPSGCEQHPVQLKTAAVKATEKCQQPRQPSPQRELRSRESIQVPEVSSSNNFETSKPDPVRTLKLSKRLHKTKETSGLNLPTFARQISKPKRQSDHKSKEDPDTLTSTMVRQSAFVGTCDALKPPSPPTLNLGMKRRHSSIVQSTEEAEPCMKRRTRSEDQRILPPTDENVPANQEKNHTRLSWPDKWEVSENARRPVPQRRSLEKKATPVKTIRRPSINGACSRAQLRGSFGLQRDRIAAMSPTDSPSHRWLRSDTIAATPIKTLRSRNVDIMGHTVPPQMASQYGIVKPKRSSMPARLKHATTTSSPGTAGAAMAKRAKTPYNPDARLLSTRSRIKRLSK